MKKKDYLKLCDKLGAIREHATNHIFAFLFNKGNIDNPYKCDIKLHETIPMTISQLFIDEGLVYFTWEGDERIIELDALSTEELLTIVFETI